MGAKKPSKKTSNGKNDPTIKVYPDTLNEVRKAVAKDPRMTIVRFYDEAARMKLTVKAIAGGKMS
jgi:hypothetical protein